MLLRSGKLGTPLERMHLENASAGLVELVALLLVEEPEAVDELVEPHAAIAIAAASAAATVTTRADRCDCVGLCIRSLCRGRTFVPASWCG